MVEHSRRAQAFAERLKAAGLGVIYPGLEDHPDYALLERLRRPEYGCGGILCLDLGDQDRAHEFMEILQNKDRFGFMAVSLGYFDTLMTAPASSTSSEMDEQALEAAGIPAGLVRISIGYTGSMEQRWSQLEAVLDSLAFVFVLNGVVRCGPGKIRASLLYFELAKNVMF